MKSIYLDNSILPKDKRSTLIATDIVSGGTALIVQSIIGFQSLSTSSGQIVLIGEIGSEKSEILRTDLNNAASGTTVSLRDALVFDHPQDTKVYIIDWNQAEFSQAATATGVKTVINTLPIQADQTYTLYNDNTVSSGFYFTRFKESIGSTFSDYSDPIPFGNYSDRTVFMIKKRALDKVNEKVDTDLITNEFLDQALWQGRREYHQMPGKRPFRRKFNIDIGNVSTGMNRVDLPSDVEKPYSAENIYGVRIGTSPHLAYYDKKEWDKDWDGVSKTTLVTTYATTHQDLYLTDVRDFPDSGSVQIEADTIGYSAKGVSGGTLRISTAGAVAHTSGVDVYNNASLGMPTNFTVMADVGGSAYIYFSCPIGTAYVNQNIYADYYRTVVDKDSDADELDEPNYDIFVPYLSYRIKERKARGAIPVIRTRTGQAFIADADYQEWEAKKNQSLATEYLGAEIRIFPDIPRWPA